MAHYAVIKRRARNRMMAGSIFLYTLRDRNRGGEPSTGVGRNFGAPSTPYANNMHSNSTNELTTARYFRSKTQLFCANYSGCKIMLGDRRGPQKGAGENFGELSTARANNMHSVSRTELTRTRNFRSKTQFWRIYSNTKMVTFRAKNFFR